MGRSARNGLSERKKQRFLKYYAEIGDVTKAAKLAKVHFQSLYEARKDDPVFAAQWEEAYQLGGNAIDAEIYRRAVDGVDKPVYYRGEEVGTIREHSDALLMFLAKAHNPSRYRERIDHTVTDSRDIDTRTDAELWQQLAAAGQVDLGKLPPGLAQLKLDKARSDGSQDN